MGTHHNFFLQVMNKILERKKISKRKRNNVFVFDPEVPKKRLQLSCKIQGNTKSKLTKKIRILLLPKTTPKIPQKLQKNLPHTTIFFFTSNEQDTRKKKNNQKKTKQAREKEIMFLFLTPRFRKKDYN